MKLYHCKHARSLRPLWTLEELGIDYELAILPFPPRQKYKEFLSISPLGTVPCFVDRELVMTESVGICQYIVDIHGGATSLRVSRSEEDYGLYVDWLHRSDATLTFPQTIFLRYSMLEREEKRNFQIAEAYKDWFLARAQSVEAALGDGRKYLCAERFTIADICVGYAIYLAQAIGIKEIMTPRVAAYWEHLSQRAAFTRADNFDL
ncbi:MAG: glutathione S-transferase family protein [Hahellaceae bacterium]|nr:glutathione S-transferase family protein [Hahellaceae bacterium]